MHQRVDDAPYDERRRKKSAAETPIFIYFSYYNTLKAAAPPVFAKEKNPRGVLSEKSLCFVSLASKPLAFAYFFRASHSLRVMPYTLVTVLTGSSYSSIRCIPFLIAVPYEPAFVYFM